MEDSHEIVFLISQAVVLGVIALVLVNPALITFEGKFWAALVAGLSAEILLGVLFYIMFPVRLPL
jgi:hypothetical protein